MKRCSKHQFLVALSFCVLLPISNAALAEDTADAPDTSKWVCKLCPVSGGWIGEWDLGFIFVDDPTPKFADYRGMIDDWYIEASGTSSYRNAEGHYFDFIGRNLGLESRQLEMRGGKQGVYELRADYSEIPRYMGHGTTTPYMGVGTDTLTLSDSPTWVPATLESKRKTYGAGLTVKFGGSWRFQADVERQTKSGTRTFSGGLFAISAALIPAPIDYTTNLFNTGLEYLGKRGQIRLEFIGSDFNNGNESLTWDSPMPLGWGDEVSRSALEPDNKFSQVSLVGAFSFSPRFRLSGKASMGEIKQNAAFLPYTINPAYDDLELPRASLNGKIETSMYNLAGRLYIKLADRLDLTAQYKVNERDNKTPIDSYTPVVLEVLQNDPRTNRPYSYKREQGKLELRWRPMNRLRLNAGAKQDILERTYQDVSESAEDSYWGEFQINHSALFGTRLKYEVLKRDATWFEEQGNYDRAENPLMRKFNMVDRDRNRIAVEFDLTPTENFDIAVSYYMTEDEYDESFLGLNESEENSINLDLNYYVSERATIYAFVTKDNIEAEMSAANGVGASPWNAFTEDEILTWGLGVSGRFTDKLGYGFEYISSEADGNILTDSGAGEAPFPVLTTKLTNARLYLDYDLSDRWGLGMDAYREEYDSADWYIDGYGPLDIEGVLTMGENSPDYDVWVVRMFATLKF